MPEEEILRSTILPRRRLRLAGDGFGGVREVRVLAGLGEVLDGRAEGPAARVRLGAGRHGDPHLIDARVGFHLTTLPGRAGARGLVGRGPALSRSVSARF